jgi:hypothetical protein
MRVSPKEFKEALESLRKTFNEASSHRDERPGYVTTDDHQIDPKWAVFERQTMLEAVNVMRVTYGLEPIAIEKVGRAERCATGHSDYYLKFPLYCAELVFDRFLPEP